MDRFYAPGDAPGDKHYSRIEQELQDKIQDRRFELGLRIKNWNKRLDDIISINEEDEILCRQIEDYICDLTAIINEIDDWYDNDEFEEMESYLWGIDKARKEWKGK